MSLFNMDCKIEKGKFSLATAIDKPRPSGSGKTLLVVSGKTQVVGDDGLVYTVAINVYRKP